MKKYGLDKDTQITNKVTDAHNKFMLYYHPKYLSAQKHSELKLFEDKNFKVYFTLNESVATSISSSPFGGVISYADASLDDFKSFLDQVLAELKASNISQIQLIQPPIYYRNFVNSNWLEQLGFKKKNCEINQYVELHKPIVLHEMQKRQLKKDWAFEIRKVDSKEIPAVHSFITKCRTDQGLAINISLAKLVLLFEKLPEAYDCFVVEKERQLIAAVVMTRATSDICYYYLPATDAAYKKLSPMVHLLKYIYAYYQELGLKYIDLGLSSITGEKQDSLFQFKERMGAKNTERVLWKMQT